MSPETIALDQPTEAPSAAVRAVPTGSLVLTPADPHLAPDLTLLIEGLIESGFLGEPLVQLADEQRFAIGPAFLSLLSFTGCAVQIRSLAEERPFTHIRIPPPSPRPRLLAGRNTRPPRCLGCRTPLADWRDRLSYWAIHPHPAVTCPNCGEIRPPWLWDWKQQGGFGRAFICIEEVFPGEALPHSALFELLIRISGMSWRHFYIQDRYD